MELETQAAFDPASFEHIPVLLNELSLIHISEPTRP